MKTIILLHGAIGAKDQLEPLAVELKQQGYNVFTFSFSGHGQTPFQTHFGIEQFALELEQFISENNLQQPTVFGYSMGGYVALYLAKQQPNLLGNIITLGTKFEWSPEIAKKEVKMLDSQTIIEKVPKFAEALQKRHGQDWELLLQKTTDMMFNLGNKNALSLNDFTAIENKVLIGLADKDNMVSLEETTAVYKQLKNGAMYMLPNTKHPIETVDVKFLTEIIIRFN
ncbi:MAG: alpha/beta hydrolase [Sphingobacteriaceae bacterium]|nr:alpha/beta hydrolase [Sphingobacteriaceae bacterium]